MDSKCQDSSTIVHMEYTPVQNKLRASNADSVCRSKKIAWTISSRRLAAGVTVHPPVTLRAGTVAAS